MNRAFTPSGKPIVADVGEQAMEEINVLQAGGNYGWPVREGTFIVPFCDQIDGSPLGADASMRWVPAGTSGEPAVTFYVRDKDQTNLRTETLARSGPHADGFMYPVFQFSHEGNNSTDALNGLAGVVGGDYYDGFWAEELRGLYLFANLSTDQLFYGSLSALEGEEVNAAVVQLPLVDANGESIALRDLVGSNRANPRFGKDRYGNLYLASKANRKLYRVQGTPRVKLTAAVHIAEGSAKAEYFELMFERPPEDDSIHFTLEVSADLQSGFAPANAEHFEVLSVAPTPRGTETVHIRYSLPIGSEQSRFFRFSWN